MNSIVAIVGRPNVGKSTLFNRLVQRREAIVDSVSGVTRDRHYGKSDWNGKEFSVIDTGGYATVKEDIFEGDNPFNLVRFQKNKTGTITGLKVSNGRARNVWFEKL